jgi:hypothetical protein
MFRQGGYLVCTYANLPAAAAPLTGYRALVTDIGPAPGTEFYCNGTIWRQIGSFTYGNRSVVAISPSAYASIFDAALTLPNGCVGAGSFFKWFADFMIHGPSGQNSFGDMQFDQLFGSQSVGASSVVTMYGDNPASCSGQLSCMTGGSSGTGNGSGRMQIYYGSYATPQHLFDSTYSPPTINFTGAITTDVQARIPNPVNSPTLYVLNASMNISGLIK